MSYSYSLGDASMTRGTVSHSSFACPLTMCPGDAFFGDNHSFNETLFEEVSIEVF